MAGKLTRCFFIIAMLLIPGMAFAEKAEIVPLRFEAMGIKIVTADEKPPQAYESICLLTASGSSLYSALKDICSTAIEKEADAVIVLNVEKTSNGCFVFCKAIKTK